MSTKQVLSRYFSKTVMVGLFATLVDVLILHFTTETGLLDLSFANVLSLMAGCAVQFLGCRYYVFRSYRGNVFRQFLQFSVAELGVLIANGVLFEVLIRVFETPPVPTRLVSAMLVFVTISFPIWLRIFMNPTRAHKGY